MIDYRSNQDNSLKQKQPSSREKRQLLTRIRETAFKCDHAGITSQNACNFLYDEDGLPLGSS